MAPQYDAITGGDTLRIPALQSPNFVTGVSGWIIRGDGSAEFNNGVFRGSITSGTSPGQHVVINNPATGDAVDVYDSSNRLVYMIDNLGRAISYVPGAAGTTGDGVIVQSGTLAIQRTDGASVVYTGAVIEFFDAVHKDGQLRLSSLDSNSGDSSLLTLHSAYLGGQPTVEGNERQIAGSLMQSDQFSVNNLTRTVRAAFTTNGSGDGNITGLGLGFTPTAVQVTPTGLSFTVPGTQIVVWRDLVTSAQCPFRVFSPGGAAFVGTMTADFTFYG